MLRMVSNVDLRKVCNTVIATIVEHIPAKGELTVQRCETARLVEHWGLLINQIGGVGLAETVEILQYHWVNNFSATTMFTVSGFNFVSITLTLPEMAQIYVTNVTVNDILQKSREETRIAAA
ncbi:uncharacterized protein PHACADRAFT_201803 [Phanerochaete carnosa HHB-10118-sp]|uniref:Uncharacterized protein n=1 Tax=Phanerochaete carnosa (strain HHB-10118-sp) TaxID=650164 RepID=K5WGK8_PHACS|nr:uncharacterized protein PHACADRAFT_201803 [Phanerochaete carnosa HHB-10118-sp]EKM49297.1 hypothetical protein PHACADRAFT_201803 [Phanerochaete carnosa HHB-10118-sp]